MMIACVVAVGVFKANGANWTEGPGFFPYGFKGVFRADDFVHKFLSHVYEIGDFTEPKAKEKQTKRPHENLAGSS